MDEDELLKIVIATMNKFAPEEAAKTTYKQASDFVHDWMVARERKQKRAYDGIRSIID